MESRTSERVVNQLLAELDEVEAKGDLIVLAATNRVDMLDPSVLRAGRFDHHIYVPLPGLKDREEIFKLLSGSLAFATPKAKEEVMALVAEQTEGFNGAELKALVDQAKLAALKRTGFLRAASLEGADFREALAGIALSRGVYQEQKDPA